VRDVRNQRRPFQPAQRADADAHRLRVGANDREIVGGRGAAILGLEDREARRGRRLRSRRRNKYAQTAKHAKTFLHRR
jgi:hypothetical protein